MAEDATHLDNLMTFETAAEGIASGDLRPTTLRVTDALSELFEAEVVLDCEVDGGIAPDVARGMFLATSAVSFGPGGLYSYGGIVREWTLETMEANGARSRYRAILVPRFWLTTLTHRSRCFNERSFPEILDIVLQETGLSSGTDYELRLVETYPTHEYTVQYQETDFAFLSRWMERLGISYLFEHADGKDKVVFTDAPNQLATVPDHPEVTYQNLSEAGVHVVGGLHDVRRTQHKLPQLSLVRDYNWRDPGVVGGQFAIDEEKGTGLQAHYGEHFKTNAEGEARARVRAESMTCRQIEYTAHSSNADFAAGMRFSMIGSPIGEMDLEYLITAVEHEASQDSQTRQGTYRNSVTMIPFERPFRAPLATPWPRIDGVMHARIDAESVSSAAPLDGDGRYRVVIPYDLYGGYGGSATRWIRKAEPYSGTGYGMHFTLHVGAEVLLAHVGGDPDRPVIVGSVPNPATGSPMTQSDSTRSAIRTRSGIFFDFEDDA